MEKSRKVVLVSLAASLMAVIFYVFGMVLANGNLIIQLIYLLMSTLLIIAAIVSLFNNYKNNKKALFIYLIIVNVVLEVLFIGNLVV